MQACLQQRRVNTSFCRSQQGTCSKDWWVGWIDCLKSMYAHRATGLAGGLTDCRGCQCEQWWAGNNADIGCIERLVFSRIYYCQSCLSGIWNRSGIFLFRSSFGLPSDRLSRSPWEVEVASTVLTVKLLAGCAGGRVRHVAA